MLDLIHLIFLPCEFPHAIFKLIILVLGIHLRIYAGRS